MVLTNIGDLFARPTCARRSMFLGMGVVHLFMALPSTSYIEREEICSWLRQ